MQEFHMYTYARYTPPSIGSPLPTLNAVDLLLVPVTSQDYARIPSTSNSHDSEPSRCDSDARDAQLKHQQWQREDSSALAMKEGLLLNDGHWSVIQYLRKHFVESGTPRHARTLARDLNRHFASKGGSLYLRKLFSGGAVTQGSRLANLRIPDDASDLSFGTRY
jgi:tRNA 2-thiouridine synthesizing protein E